MYFDFKKYLFKILTNQIHIWFSKPLKNEDKSIFCKDKPINPLLFAEQICVIFLKLIWLN
jgi:hypothetical protein